MSFGDLFDRAAEYETDEDAVVRALADERAGEEKGEPNDDGNAG